MSFNPSTFTLWPRKRCFLATQMLLFGRARMTHEFYPEHFHIMAAQTLFFGRAKAN
jgi:hypothetical protein